MSTAILSPYSPVPPQPVAPLTTLLNGLAQRCVTTLPSASGCGLNLLTTDGRRITSVATDSTAERMNALHDRFPANPGSAAWRGETMLQAETSDTDERWAGWLAGVRDLGVNAVLAAPLVARDRTLGSVLVLSDTAFFSASEVASLSEILRGVRPQL